MRDEFFQRLVKRGLTLERKDFDAAQPYVNRMLDSRISTLAFGDSTAKRRFVKEDAQLKKALELLRRGSTTKDLLAMAATTPARLARPEPR
jgi:carboxyl-terminal processing protease